MTRTVEMQNSFTYGEIGVDLQARQNLEEYTNSVSFLNNFVPTTSGGIRYREATRHLVESDMPFSRVIPFIFNRLEAYTISISLLQGNNFVIRVFDATGEEFVVNQVSDFYGNQLRRFNLTQSGFHYVQKGDLLILTHTLGLIPPLVIARNFNSETSNFEFNVGFINDTNLSKAIPKYLSVLATPYFSVRTDLVTMSGGFITATTDVDYDVFSNSFTGPPTLLVPVEEISLDLASKGSGESDPFIYKRFNKNTDSSSLWEDTEIVSQATQIVWHNTPDITGLIPLFTLIDGVKRDALRIDFNTSSNTIQPVYNTPYSGELPIVSLFYRKSSHTNLVTGQEYSSISDTDGWYLRLASTANPSTFGYEKLILREVGGDDILEFNISDFARSPYEAYAFEKVEGTTATGAKYNRTVKITGAREFEEFGFQQYVADRPEIDLTGLNVEIVLIKGTPVGLNNTKVIMKNSTNEFYANLSLDADAPDSSNIRVQLEQLVSGSFEGGEYDIYVSPWNGSQGYPKTTTLYQERSIFGGTSTFPDTLFCSYTSDIFRLHYNKMLNTPEDFPDLTTDLLDSSAFSFAPASSEVNVIQWLVSGDVLAIGTIGGEFVTTKGSDVFTPFSKVIKKQSAIGGSSVQGFVADSSIYYIGRNGKSLNEFTYFDSNQQHKSINVSLLNPKIIENGAKEQGIERGFVSISQMVWHDNRKTLWVVTNIGRLIGCVLDVSNNVTAWFRCDLGSFGDYRVNSVAVLPSTNVQNDDLSISISRKTSNINDVNEVWQHSIEVLPIPYEKENIIYTETSTFYDEEACYLDGAVKLVLSPLLELLISQGGPLEEVQFVNGVA